VVPEEGLASRDQRMLSSWLEYELDALANKDFQYLTKRYLPRKLEEQDWLD
jgi:DNA topoisomerase VI subunit A